MNKEKKAHKMRNMRRLRYGTASTVLTVVVVAAVILLNVIVGIVADRHPVSLDLSADKVYTLSEQSIQIAEKADQPMEIVVFDDESHYSNPNFGVPELDTTMREFYNSLQQYNKRSKGKITYSFINPNQEPTKFAKYAKYEVKNFDVLFLCGERYKICSLNDMYLVDQSAAQYGAPPRFESKVEKIMASTINSLQGENDRLVQVLVGHEEDSDAIQGLKSLYELNGYRFEEINITGSKEFNKDAEIMLIGAPAKDYSAAEIKRVQQWLYNNGNYGRQLMVFVHPTADCPNLYELLNIEYGIKVTNELILETELDRVQNYNSTYPMCDVPKNDYTVNASGTGHVFTPTVRRLTTKLPTAANQDAISKLGIPLTAYPESAQLIKLEDLKNDGKKDKDKESAKPYKAPNGEYPLTSMIVCQIDSYNNTTGNAVKGRVMVSGCSAMAYAPFLQNNSFKNEELLLDALNGMTGNKDSIAISNKSLTADTIRFNGKTALVVGLGVFTVGLPLVILIICLVVFLRRKNL